MSFKFSDNFTFGDVKHSYSSSTVSDTEGTSTNSSPTDWADSISFFHFPEFHNFVITGTPSVNFSVQTYTNAVIFWPVEQI